MAELVSPLVRPLEAENAAVVRTRLKPAAFYSEDKVAGEDGDDFFQAPAGALVWAAPPSETEPGPGGEDRDILAVCFIDKDKDKLSTEPLPVPLGVVASPVEDPGLLHRHPDELAHLAVYVSGTHTIFATEDDCRRLFPTAYIKAEWPDGAGDRPLLDTGRGRKKFYVPRFTQVDSASSEGAFAMVLQSGKSELRILLLVQRFEKRE